MTNLTVFAGSSRLAALPLLAADAPLWVLWLLWATAFCLNLRFVIFIWGGVALNWRARQLPSIAGILLAARVLTEWGLRDAPLAARVVVVLPLIVMTPDGQLLRSRLDARLYAAAVGTILSGTAVMLALRIGLGW